MRIRRNLRRLNTVEKSAFVQALLTLKQSGEYDAFIEWHHHAMMCATPMPGENPHWRYRNAAHRGPAFFPWHRDYINEFELRLQKIDPSVTLPYWNWAEDAEMQNPATAPIWDEDFLGGSGRKEDNYEVLTGAFAYKAGNWTIPLEFDGPQLLRGFGEFPDPTGIVIKTLPTREDLAFLSEEIIMDSPPWNCAPSTIGFRNRAEGWVTKSGDYRVKTEGVQLHNRVHVWIGGTMAKPASPGDPAFFLHHCFIDKLWVDWERRLRTFYNAPNTHHNHFSPPNTPSPGYYLPVTGGPPGHNIFDKMFPPPWDVHRTVRPIDMLDHSALGYLYDDEGEVRNLHDHHTEAERQKMRAFTV